MKEETRDNYIREFNKTISKLHYLNQEHPIQTYQQRQTLTSKLHKTEAKIHDQPFSLAAANSFILPRT